MSSLLVMSGLMALCVTTTVQVAPPRFESQPPVSDEPSRIIVSLETPLEELQKFIESTVPTQDMKSGAWTMVDDGSWGLKWEVTRTPMSMTASSQTLRVGTTLHYKAWACKRMHKPWPLRGDICPEVASCEGSMQAWLDATPEVTQDWKVNLHAKPGANPLSRCEVTVLNIDVTDRITSALTRKLGEAAGKLEERLSQTVHQSAGDAWRKLQDPLPLERGFWLALRPQGVQLASFEVRDNRLVNQMGFSTDVRIRSERPQPTALPLPRPGFGASGPDFRVALEGELDYASASRLLGEALRGRTYTQRGNTLTVKDVTVEGVGGLAVMKVDFSGGDTDGVLYLVGTPHYDPATRILGIKDLDFSMETKDTVMQLSAWLLHDELREDLRQRATWPLASLGDAAASLSALSLTRQLGEKARMEAQLSQVHIRGVETSQSGFRVRARLDGRAIVTVVP